MRNPFKKNKETFEALFQDAFDIRVKLTKLNDETTKTKQELSVVLSGIEGYNTHIVVELNESLKGFGVKPELWF